MDVQYAMLTMHFAPYIMYCQKMNYEKICSMNYSLYPSQYA